MPNQNKIVVLDLDDENIDKFAKEMSSHGKVFIAFLADRPIPLNIPDNKIEIFKEMRKANLKYKYFSDCMQVFTSLKTKKYHSIAINSVYGMLSSCGAMLLLSLAEKKVFRAGIDIGIGIEIDENEVYGPALFRAYVSKSTTSFSIS